MTREEAIEKITHVKYCYAYEDDYEAFDMAIEALKAPTESTNTPTDIPTNFTSKADAIDAINAWLDCASDTVIVLPSSDRPTGEVNAVEIYEKAVNDLDHNRITLGEFNKRIEPLKHLFYDRPTGKWVFDDDEGEYVCSGCKRLADINTTTGEWVLSRYCGDCGAYMVNNNSVHER